MRPWATVLTLVWATAIGLLSEAEGRTPGTEVTIRVDLANRRAVVGPTVPVA